MHVISKKKKFNENVKYYWIFCLKCHYRSTIVYSFMLIVRCLEIYIMESSVTCSSCLSFIADGNMNSRTLVVALSILCIFLMFSTGLLLWLYCRNKQRWLHVSGLINSWKLIYFCWALTTTSRVGFYSSI